MGLARAHAIALVGVQGHPVEIEADIENGMVALLLVGLPDTALREARDRIRSAIVNSGEAWPARRITVGLSPASLPKRGSAFDLGIAMAILAAAGSVPGAALRGLVLIGELGLDGRVRPVPGVLPAAAAAAAAGFGGMVVAEQNAAEAALVSELQVIATPSLEAFTAWVRAGQPPGQTSVTVLAAGRDAGSARTCSPAALPAVMPAVVRTCSWAALLTGTPARPAGPDPPLRPGRRRRPRTWPTWSASRSPGERPRYARPAATTSCCSGRPAWGRRCWRSGYRR